MGGGGLFFFGGAGAGRGAARKVATRLLLLSLVAAAAESWSTLGIKSVPHPWKCKHVWLIVNLISFDMEQTVLSVHSSWTRIHLVAQQISAVTSCTTVESASTDATRSDPGCKKRYQKEADIIRHALLQKGNRSGNVKTWNRARIAPIARGDSQLWWKFDDSLKYLNVVAQSPQPASYFERVPVGLGLNSFFLPLIYLLKWY